MVPSTSTKPRQRGKSKQTDKAIPDPTISEEELRKYYASNRRSRLIIFAICVLFRLGNASVTRTYDNPDEYWQAQEVAHRLVFGYGYVTWEWRERIRSFAHPLIFAALYKALQILRLEDTAFFVTAPRYLESILAATADYYIYNLAKKTVGDNIAPSVLFCTLASFFNFHMAGRTLSNSLEMVLTTVALNYWPLDGVVTYNNSDFIGNFRVSLAWAALACVIRPTNALLWGFLGLRLLYKAWPYRSAIIANTAVVLITSMTFATVLDTWCYDGHLGNILMEPVFTPGKFFELNVVSAISMFYGIHSWHWYLSQGIPVVLAGFLPTFLFGWYRIGKDTLLNERITSLKQLIIWTVIVYSLLAHKEFRFIYPVVPIMHIIAAYGISQLPARWRKWIVLTILSLNISLGLYTTTTHQRGVMDAVEWVRMEAMELRRKYTEYDMEVAFLMPCHSTPWQSIMHDNKIKAWFLTCEPPLAKNSEDYKDEADKFYEDPTTFIEERIFSTSSRKSPTQIIAFDSLLQMPSQDNENIGSLLRDRGGYFECQRFFNSHFHDDWRRTGDVIILCHSDNQ